MLFPTETLELLAANAQIDAHFEHQRRKMRPRAEEKVQKENPRNGLFKPFLGLLGLAGAVRFELTARGFGAAGR